MSGALLLSIITRQGRSDVPRQQTVWGMSYGVCRILLTLSASLRRLSKTAALHEMFAGHVNFDAPGNCEDGPLLYSVK